jgi:hypothetical protein
VLSDNTDLTVLRFVEKNKKIYWPVLSQNPSAIPLLEKYPKEIEWGFLSMNPNAIHLLKKNPDKINWWTLSENPNPDAMHLLGEKLKKDHINIDWGSLSSNPSIFLNPSIHF